jgi:hypothetical protein
MNPGRAMANVGLNGALAPALSANAHHLADRVPGDIHVTKQYQDAYLCHVCIGIYILCFLTSVCPDASQAKLRGRATGNRRSCF